jgi:putative membrane protein
MKFIVWLIRVLVFVLLLVLALSNTQTAHVEFPGWLRNGQAPLILIGLAFFVVGLAGRPRIVVACAVPAAARKRPPEARVCVLHARHRWLSSNPAVAAVDLGSPMPCA